MTRKSLTKPISTEREHLRNWQVLVNESLVGRVESLVIDHPQIGTLTYGQTPHGYDGWTFHEELGGGAVVLPFVIIDGELFVGVVLQDRPNQGGEVWNAPRGFLEPNEDRRLGAARELAEEVGLRVPTTSVFALPGALGNPNSAFFETWGEGEGVAFFGIEVAEDLVTRDSAPLCFRPEVLDQSPEAKRSRQAEAISHASFVPWIEAAQLGDLFTNAAVARLLVHLCKQGRRAH